MPEAEPEAGDGAGLLFVVSAPSGTGKTTVVERLVQVVPDLALSRSYTSRPARAGETDGVDYNFITRARFEEMIAADAFLEWADVFGNLYGTGAADAERELAGGRDLVLVIDVQGARQVRQRYAPRSASSCCRRRSRCSSSGCAAAARTPKRRCSGGCRRRGTKSPRSSNTTTSSSTTSSRPASIGCGRSCWPSGRGCDPPGRRRDASSNTFDKP